MITYTREIMAQQYVYLDEMINLLSEAVNIPERLLINLLISVAVIFFLLIIRFIVLRIIYRHVEDVSLHYKWKKNLSYIVGVIGLILIGRVWFEGFQSFATILGLVAAGLVIALRDTVNDLAGWVYVMSRKPFDIGDRIQIGAHKGDVVDKRLFKFTIMEIGNWVDADQSTGRVIHIPNQKILNESISNYTAGFDFIWNEIQVNLTFESNWEKAKQLIKEIAESHSQNVKTEAGRQIRRAAKSYMIVYRHLTPTVYTRVEQNGISLTVRYLTNPRTRRGTEEKIWEDVLRAFRKESDIEFAYPTTRMFLRNEEGAVIPAKNRPESSDDKS